ncbi:MAG: glycosyltransferase family 2 protein [Dethiobacter sp.]|nr:glycosyltransferase family 2 protein [Dethiobacter sp.]
MSLKTKSVSVVIPVFNELECIARLHMEVVEVCEREGYNYEVIIVDDGSTDGSGKVIKQLAPLKYVCLRRNFGQTAAMDCGIKQAGGELIVTMDGDRQNDPADIPRLIRYLEENDLDVVSGWRKDRQDPFMKKLSSRAANFMRNLMIKDGLNDSGCSLKVYRADCFKGISLYGEMHRFIPAVLKIKGFKIGECKVNHRPRTTGKTKYGWKRGLKGLIDMVSVWFWHKYAVRPLHLLGGMGAVFFAAGFMISAVGVIFHFAGIELFRYFLPVLASFLLISGIQFFLFGLIADMLSKNYFETTSDQPYSVREVYESRDSLPKRSVL